MLVCALLCPARCHVVTQTQPDILAPAHPSLQLFLAFNATAHSLIAHNLSRGREGRAAEVLVRIAQLAVAVSLPLAGALFAGRGLLPGLFTGDVLVQQEVASVLPLLLIIMPLDALGTVLEGGLLGASDTGYLGARTAASCCLSLLALGLASLAHANLLTVWMGLKVLNAAALALDVGKFILGSRGSGSGGSEVQAAAPTPPAAPATKHE
jgi:Na+-driven multidrug efflux pump